MDERTISSILHRLSKSFENVKYNEKHKCFIGKYKDEHIDLDFIVNSETIRMQYNVKREVDSLSDIIHNQVVSEKLSYRYKQIIIELDDVKEMMKCQK